MASCVDSIEKIPSPFCYLLFVLNLLLPGTHILLRLGDYYHVSYTKGRNQRNAAYHWNYLVFILLDTNLLDLVGCVGSVNHP